MDWFPTALYELNEVNVFHNNTFVVALFEPTPINIPLKKLVPDGLFQIPPLFFIGIKLASEPTISDWLYV